MKKTIKYLLDCWRVYYPVILAFISFLYSVALWFNGFKLEGIFVGLWVPSILSLSVAIRQRRNKDE
tara:strand:- start:205 stop:402 length:198 start_codon:yes stop_codon:yes gene_type:complete